MSHNLDHAVKVGPGCFEASGKHFEDAVPALVDDSFEALIRLGGELQIQVGNLGHNSLERTQSLTRVSADDGREFVDWLVLRLREEAFQELKRDLDGKFVAEKVINQLQIVGRVPDNESATFIEIFGRTVGRKANSACF